MCLYGRWWTIYLVYVAATVDGGHRNLRWVQLDLAHDFAHHVGEHVALALGEQVLGDLRNGPNERRLGC